MHPRDLGPSPDALCQEVREKAENRVFQGSRLLYPSPFPPAHPTLLQILLGREGVPGLLRPSPRTPRRPTRPEAPRCRPGVPCRPGPCAPGLASLAYSQRGRTGCVADGSGQSPTLPGTGSWPPRSALHHPPGVPLLLPPSCCRLDSVPTSQPSKQRAEIDRSAPCLSITPQLGEGTQGHSGSGDGQQRAQLSGGRMEESEFRVRGGRHS